MKLEDVKIGQTVKVINYYGADENSVGRCGIVVEASQCDSNLPIRVDFTDVTQDKSDMKMLRDYDWVNQKDIELVKQDKKIEIGDIEVGDRVRIASERSPHWNVAGKMDEYFGRIMTISSISPESNKIWMVEDNGKWMWDIIDIVEIISDNDEYTSKMEFTKDDLKTGMIVVDRDGDRSTVLRGTPMGDYLINKDGHYLSMYNLNDDLTVPGVRDLDIVAVHSPLECTNLLSDEFSDYKLTWKRQENGVELTVQEISEKLGYKVKVVE